MCLRMYCTTPDDVLDRTSLRAAHFDHALASSLLKRMTNDRAASRDVCALTGKVCVISTVASE